MAFLILISILLLKLYISLTVKLTGYKLMEDTGDAVFDIVQTTESYIHVPLDCIRVERG